MAIREIKAPGPSGLFVVGTVATSVSHRAQKYPLTMAVVYLDTDAKGRNVGVRLHREGGDTIVSLSPGAALEVAKGILLNLRADYLATDEELLSIFASVKAAGEADAKALRTFLDDRSHPPEIR